MTLSEVFLLIGLVAVGLLLIVGVIVYYAGKER